MGTLFTSLLNSTSALQVFGRSLDVIQNNISNAITPGYAKQSQSLIAAPFDPHAGFTGGVIAGPVISARSEFFEQAVRAQQEALGYAGQKAGDLGLIEPLFDLTSDSGLSGAINKLFDSFSQLSVSPNDAVARQSVIDQAAQTAQSFQQTALGIAQVSDNIVSQTRDTVTAINRIGAQLADFNKLFRANSENAENAGIDAQVHTALEELSGLANFTLVKSNDGSLNVYLGGQTPLVTGDHQFAVSADFSSPQTVIRDSQGNDITAQISGGSLGALMEEKNSVLPGYLNSLNTLARTLADQVNATLAQGVDQNGATPAAKLFTYDQAADAASTLRVSGITPDQIAAALPNAPGGNGNAIALAQLANAPLVQGFTFIQAYGNLGAQVGRDVASAKQDRGQRQDLLMQTRAMRSDATGVSLNEEAAKLLQFQQAYQAVGKLVGVLDGLTQTLMDIIQ
jgi:flagellar hook-associated protein 1 FlgK